MLNCGDLVELKSSTPMYRGKVFVITGIHPTNIKDEFTEDTSKIQYICYSVNSNCYIPAIMESDLIQVGSIHYNNLIGKELIIDDNLLNTFKNPENLLEEYQFSKLNRILLENSIYENIQNYKSITFLNAAPLTYGNNYLTNGMKIIGKFKNKRHVEKSNESISVDNKKLFDFVQTLKHVTVTRKDIYNKVSFIPSNIWNKEILGDIDKLTEIKDSNSKSNKIPVVLLKEDVSINQAVNRLAVYESLGTPKEISEMKKKLKLLEYTFNEN